jgi:hypothetical protein
VFNPLPVDQLILKGTHNSYSCRGEGDLDPPCMNHPPEKQIDDFGVWSLELDFSVNRVNGVPTALVGHDRPGHGTCWGLSLKDFFRMIRGTLSIKYRPVFVNFDIKDWGDSGLTAGDKYAVGVAAAREVFQGDLIELEKFVADNGRVPTVPELAGKVVLYAPNQTLRGTHADHCVSREVVERSIRSGKPVEEGGADCGPNGCRVFRLDQYQADWTFQYGAPPNPLVVDSTARPPWTVADSEGDSWGCDNGDVSHHQVVHEHGTYRFPYASLRKAVVRARGVTPNGGEDPRRAGYGWTVLVRPGVYPENLTIDTPLVLMKDLRYEGTVKIGR